MGNHKFNYNNLDDLRRDMKKYNINLPLDKNLNLFDKVIKLRNNSEINNRLAIHPMEGCDAEKDGSPGELTRRRYLRYARGGAGLIWFEAVAVKQSGRANENQLFLHQDNLDNYINLINKINEFSQKVSGFKPYLVLQLAHSGRFGENKQFLFHEKETDRAAGINSDHSVITDEELEKLEDEYVNSAHLAAKAGFDAVDIKACHRYLLSEMLAAFTREGKYGGSYENRTRFIKNVINKIRQKLDIDVALRLNIYDGIPYPYGWGSDARGNIDLTEPKKLVSELDEMGVSLINVSLSTPYLKPHFSRPYDKVNKSSEHPLKGVERLIYLSKEIKQQVENVIIVGTGYTWLRQFAPYIGAGVLKKEWADLIGFGRQAFAYPDFARDILKEGKLQKNKVCITCSKCTELKAAQKPAGCVIRDEDIYLDYYQELKNGGQ